MTPSEIPPGADRPVSCEILGDFAGWMAQANGSLAITTYQAGKVVIVGWDGRQVNVLLRHFDKPMGLAHSGRRIALATRHEITLFADAPLLAHDYLENQRGTYDALYLPRVSYWTGDLNVHDVAYADDGLWVVATRFCCLARLSDEYSFVPVWRPPFLTDTVPEDRCHLNGLAVVDGKPAFVTALGTTDVVGGWRADKATGGIVMRYPDGEIITRGLAMPHSPRWHDGRLWVLNSGGGELWRIDPATGHHDVVCALPGYLRGLAFVGHYALIGMCQIREKHIFGGLPVQTRHPMLHCGVALIDTRTGLELGRLAFTTGAQELFEVAFLPGLRRPMLLNRDKPATRDAFTAPDFSYWLRPSNIIEDRTHG
ncbi:MAG: TIGR03032 family protein [Gemmataceae bacterium]|nr:TIGR03032 family protein [Gemmataceae bacterium]